MKFKKTLSFIGCTLLIFTSVSTNLSSCFATGDYITEINVDVNNVDDIKRKLNYLCNQFNYSHGIQTDDDLPGWEKSAYQYFFEAGSGHYNFLPQNEKSTFAKCIEAMYLNKNNTIWHDAIKNVLVLLSSHGGHCAARATALVESSYNLLSQFLIDHNI